MYVLLAIPHVQKLHNFTLYLFVIAEWFLLPVSEQRVYPILLFGQWKSLGACIALSRILETVVTFHFSGGKVYSMNKGCHTCMIKHTMHVQSLHCSAYLTWLDVCIYLPRSHFHFLKRMLGKGQLRTA